MSEQAGLSTGLRTGIYDLGYRAYEGARLGRPYAVLSLFVFSLRAIFGLGRPLTSKLFPVGLAVIALVPALVQLAIAAVAPAEFEFASPENYFSFINIVLALFCAVAAPEVVGRDQRHHTLALYFSRALSRTDYVTAKLGALLVALLAVELVPQALLLTGNAVATETVLDYLYDNLDQVPPILASGLLVAAMMGSISLAIACQTPRRYWATGAVITYFVVATTLGAVLVETLSDPDAGYALLLSPFGVLEGSVYWLFGAEPGFDSDLAKADLQGGYYALAAVAYSLAGLAVLYRRFWRLPV